MTRLAWLILAWGIIILTIVDGAYSVRINSDATNKYTHHENKTNNNKERLNGPVFTVLVESFDTAEGIIDRHEKLLIVLATFAIAGFTFTLWRATDGLFAMSRTQALDMKESLRIARDSIKEMQASRRAWIKIEDVKLIHPTIFTEDYISFNVSITIKNIGQTPATRVWVETSSYYIRENSIKFTDAEKTFITKIRRGVENIPVGHTLFPQDVLIHTIIWNDAKEKIKSAIRTSNSGERKIDFDIFIAIGYKIVGDTKAHVTYNIYSMLNVPIGTTISNGQTIDIPHTPFHNCEPD